MRTAAVEVHYGWLVAGATSLYMLTSCIYRLAFSTSYPKPAKFVAVEIRDTRALKIFLGISFIIIIAYFTNVGYSAFFAGIQNILSGNERDVTTLRLESYTGAQYLYPGYVNQFKNAIAPSLVIVLISSNFATRRRNAILYSGILGFAAVAGLVATGQRGPLLLAVLVVLCYTSLRAQGEQKRRNAKRSIWILVSALLLMMLGTLILGRRAESQHSGVFENGSALLGEIGDRVLFGNQQSGIAGYRYTELLPTAYGDEWIQDLLGILPGNRGSTLSNMIFQTLYGDTRGTSPPSLWGSIDYNFGIAGLVIAPIVLAIALQTISSVVLYRQSYNSLELVGMAGMFVTVGTWTNGGPAYLLNVGLVAYFALWKWGRQRSVRDHLEIAHSASPPRKPNVPRSG